MIDLFQSEEFWAGFAVVVSLIIGNSQHALAGGEKFKTLKRIREKAKRMNE